MYCQNVLGNSVVNFHTWRLHPLVVVGVNADFILLEVEGVLAGLDGTQLVMAVQVGPSPQAAVDDMRKSFAVRNLQTPVQRSDPSIHREMEEREHAK